MAVSSLAAGNGSAAADRIPKPADGEEAIVTLPAFRVHGEAISSFSVGLRVLGDAESGMVYRIYVWEVTPGSGADREGIEIGDRVLSIDDRRVTEYASSFTKGSDLGRIFLSRPPGSSVKLEVVSWRAGWLRTVVLVVPERTGGPSR